MAQPPAAAAAVVNAATTNSTTTTTTTTTTTSTATSSSSSSSSPQTSSVADHTDWLRKMQQYHLQGILCDTIIRLHLPSTGEEDDDDDDDDDDGNSSDGDDGDDEDLEVDAQTKQLVDGDDGGDDEDDVVDKNDKKQEVEKICKCTIKSTRTVKIRCHALVLSVRSPYFASTLRGRCEATKNKTITLKLPNDRVEDLRLLLKLNYNTSYIYDDNGHRFDHSTRLRLAFLGNALEFSECVNECLESLAEEKLTAQEALTIVDEFPEDLRGHAAVPKLMAHVVEALAAGIDELTDEQKAEGAKDKKAATTQTATLVDCKKEIKLLSDALAKALGPVHQFFEEGSVRQGDIVAITFYETLLLKEHIKGFSEAVMDTLLASDKLQCQVENEVYYFLGAWCYQSSHVSDRASSFTRLKKNIRSNNLSLDYLGATVTCCPLARESHAILEFVRSHAYCHDTNKTSLAAHKEISAGQLRDRGNGKLAWSFDATVPLKDIVSVKAGEQQSWKALGLAYGYPVVLSFFETGGNLSAYAWVKMAPLEVLQSVQRCVGFECSLRLGTKQRDMQHFYCDTSGFGYADFFSTPWAKVMKEQSVQFPDDAVPVKLTLLKL